MSNVDLLRQYVDTGLCIPKNQFEKLNNNLKKTYIRKRKIAIAEGSKMYHYELSFLPEKVLVSAIEHGAKTIHKILGDDLEFDLFNSIENPTEEMKIAAVKHDPAKIRFFDDTSEEIQLAAVQKDGEIIYYISNPSEKVQFAAINQNPWSYFKIHKPTENVKEWAKESGISGRVKFHENINRIKTLLNS